MEAHLCRDSNPPTSTSQAINLSASSITKVCMQSRAQDSAFHNFPALAALQHQS